MENERDLNNTVEDPENESYVYLSDLIKDQEELEDHSIAVYGASDEKICSYDNVSNE